MKPPPRLLLPRPAGAAVSALLVAVLLLPSAAAACTPPYEAQPGPYSLRIAPGETRDFASGLVVAAGERVLIEGTARVVGGLTINGTLFFSSTASSTLSAEWVAVGAGGALVAGSEACPLPAGVVATLELRDGSVHPQAGRKALAVFPGGTLEVRLQRQGGTGGQAALAAPAGRAGSPCTGAVPLCGRRRPTRAPAGVPRGASQLRPHPPTPPPTPPPRHLCSCTAPRGWTCPGRGWAPPPPPAPRSCCLTPRRRPPPGRQGTALPLPRPTSTHTRPRRAAGVGVLHVAALLGSGRDGWSAPVGKRKAAGIPPCMEAGWGLTPEAPAHQHQACVPGQPPPRPADSEGGGGGRAARARQPAAALPALWRGHAGRGPAG